MSTAHFQHALELGEPPWRPSNHWKPRPLTSASRMRCRAAVKVEMDVGAMTSVETPGKMAGNKTLKKEESEGGKGPDKVAIQPSMLTFVQNGAERVRVTKVQRSRSASVQSGGGWRRVHASASPYLQEQTIRDTVPQRRSSPQSRRSSRQEGVKKASPPTQQQQQQRRHSEVPRCGATVADTAERIGRYQPGTPVPQLYKAALVLMQAQRDRAPLVQTPAGTRRAQQHQNPHDYYHSQQPPRYQLPQHFSFRRGSVLQSRPPPKSILRQSPALSHRTLSTPSLQRSPSALSTQSFGLQGKPVNGSLESSGPAPRKKVTFGADVVVQLSEPSLSARVLDHAG